MANPATEATIRTTEDPTAKGRYPTRLRRAEIKHTKEETPRSMTVVFLARKATLSRPISPITSPAFLPRSLCFNQYLHTV